MLQASVLEIWKADRSKADEASRMAAALAAANSKATLGQFSGSHSSLTSSAGTPRDVQGLVRQLIQTAQD